MEVPFWKSIIHTSARLYEILQLGYYEVDFVLDIDKGPVILEANARPGLAIQIANRLGPAGSLQQVDTLLQRPASLDEGIDMLEAINNIQ
ncbi:MAG: sugar-transfer associated ATP-grasp domain-containing protein [bacterium]